MGIQLECKNVTLGYEGSIVTEGIDFTINKGDYLYILGENGSGKSTLIKALLGLKAPIGGTIDFGDGVGKNEIGYLPQQTVVQRDFPASVKEIVRSGFTNRCGFRPFFNRQEKETSWEIMNRLEIDSIASRCYRELSGGQQQRVLLARALCATRKMLLLDEPVTGLDPKAASEMYELIYDLNKNDGITVIMVSHDINAAVRFFISVRNSFSSAKRMTILKARQDRPLLISKTEKTN